MPAHVVSSDREGHGAPAYVFVGERRSSRAIALGVHWEDGRLAARTLHDALRALGLDPARQTYVNLLCETDPRAVDADILASIHRYDRAGATIVEMGRPVQEVLAGAGVPHLRLIHPAARGSIRARTARPKGTPPTLPRCLAHHASRGRISMDLFAVVIEDLRRATLEQVMLYAAEKPEDAEALARAFYLADGKIPGNYRFSAQRMTDISGPGDTRYRVVLHPLPQSAS